jgi:hypothetical protein
MSNTIMSTTNTTGVRRLRTLSGPWMGSLRGDSHAGLGSYPDPDTIAGLVAAGYSQGELNTLVSMGATDEQLLALPYPADPGEMADAMITLMNRLGGALPASGAPASSAGSYPQAAVPTTVSTAWGVYDLTQEASWNAINGLFSNVQQQLNTTARQAPNDPDVIAHVQQFNSLVVQWAGYYQQAFGSSPSPLPLASLPSGGAMGRTLGIVPVVIVAAVAVGVVALLGTLYAIYAWNSQKQALIAATAASQNIATTGAQSTANSLLQQANQVQASNPTLATQLRQQASSLIGQTITATTPQPNAPGALTNWFTANWGYLAILLAGVVIVPPLITGKRR